MISPVMKPSNDTEDAVTEIVKSDGSTQTHVEKAPEPEINAEIAGET